MRSMHVIKIAAGQAKVAGSWNNAEGPGPVIPSSFQNWVC